MDALHRYTSPLGEITLASDGTGLTGLWFEGQKHYAYRLQAGSREQESSIFDEACVWLDTYFAGRDPGPTPQVSLRGTEFYRQIWALLQDIPYGQTATYGGLAHAYAARSGRDHMSAQAVGQAIGHNPISLIVPCHRVVGANGSLTGYAAGIDKKTALLQLEGIDTSRMFVPKAAKTPRYGTEKMITSIR